MPSFKILGGQPPASPQIGDMTRGLGFPLVPIEETDFAIVPAEVLFASDFTNQAAVEDVPTQVTFGEAVGTPQDSVMMDALGNLTINQAGTYMLVFLFHVERPASVGELYHWIRQLVDGSQIENSILSILTDDDMTIPVTIGDVQTFTAGQVVTIEHYADSVGIEDGGLVSGTSSIGWNPSSSAQVKVIRLK